MTRIRSIAATITRATAHLTGLITRALTGRPRPIVTKRDCTCTGSARHDHYATAPGTPLASGATIAAVRSTGGHWYVVTTTDGHERSLNCWTEIIRIQSTGVVIERTPDYAYYGS